jgi:hypothetical protein
VVSKLILAVLFLVTIQKSFCSWDSQFPRHINDFIYKKTINECILSDYIDGIGFEETKTNPDGSLVYIGSYSVFGEYNGFIEVKESKKKRLSVLFIECPNNILN